MRKNQGFIMLYVIIIITVMGMLGYALINLMEINSSYISMDKDTKKFDLYAKNRALVISKLIKYSNNDWSTADSLSCLWWVVMCYEWAAAACSTNNWVFWSDGISDTCDNDDHKWSYSTGNVDTILSGDSKLTDDDDLARKLSFWFIFPNDSDTVFAENDTIKNMILGNPNNSNPNVSLLWWIDNILLAWSFSFTWSRVDVYEIDKAVFNASKDINIINSYSGKILTQSWFFTADWNFADTWTPMIFNFTNYDYAINVANSDGVKVLQYTLSWSKSSKLVYIMPVDDSLNPMKILIPRYEMLNWDLIYRSKISEVN